MNNIFLKINFFLSAVLATFLVVRYTMGKDPYDNNWTTVTFVIVPLWIVSVFAAAPDGVNRIMNSSWVKKSIGMIWLLELCVAIFYLILMVKFIYPSA